MNKSLLAVFALVGLVVGIGAGYFAFKPADNLGVSISANSALNQARLQTELGLIAAPASVIGTGASSAIDFTSLATSTLFANTTTVITGLAGALGDQVLCAPATPTAGVQFSCYVSTASTTSATFTVNESLTAFVAVDATSTVFNVKVLPQSTFIAPTGL